MKLSDFELLNSARVISSLIDSKDFWIDDENSTIECSEKGYDELLNITPTKAKSQNGKDRAVGKMINIVLGKALTNLVKETYMDKKNNSGHRNSGNRNSGDFNSGHRNSGNLNSGDFNSGYFNSGNYNSGNRNSGDLNSGYYNSGNYNSGDFNSGDFNSGYFNSGYYNSGHFNTNEPTVRLFNKDTGLKQSEIQIPHIYLPISEWISEENMTDKQKKADRQFFVKKGTLITRTYKEAWDIAWAGMSEETKQKFLNLPNFDAGIFLEITGIDVRQDKTQCEGKIVEIDGKKYKLQSIE